MEEHDVTIRGREEMEVNGVNNVMSFDEEMIVLDTDMGHLSIKGGGLNITNLTLNEGKMTIKGHIDALEYRDVIDIKAKGRSFMRRILK
jgi:sporulation protein YabP